MTHRLMFQGGERKYCLWEVKFLDYFRIQKLYNTITAGIDYEINPNKNTQAFGKLVQYLDDRNLSLIIRDANKDGRKALKN